MLKIPCKACCSFVRYFNVSCPINFKEFGCFRWLLMPCLHLDIYRGKRLLTLKPWYICTVFILTQITEVKLSSNTVTIKSNWQQILKPMHKIPVFIREAVALVVLAFYFLVLELQTQGSRFQQPLLLQHLKMSRRKRLILLQIALRKTRRVRRALSWPTNQSWFETLLHGNLVDDWWKENLRISDVCSITLSDGPD